MLLLASQSPRRAELLTQLNVAFEQQSADIDESQIPGETPRAYVERLAIGKAKAIQTAENQHLPILGSDTTVSIDGKVLGKPTDASDSRRMLKLLSGRKHQVYTSVALVKGERVLTSVVETAVQFKNLSDEEIDWYWHTGEPQDKAGSYAIQGLGGQFVIRIQGSYSAVVGLPLYETMELIKEMGMSTSEC